MSGVRSFTRNAIYMLGLGASSLALSAHPAAAQEAARDNEEPIVVVGERPELQSPRYTAPLLETPQTITIVPRELIEEQNLFNLRDVLSTLPGITFGAGEGGGGYGDSINLRGYSANNDITVDGVRDSAQYTRSDTFNMEQVELVNGANSVYAGSGSIGGSINLVSKTPHGEDVDVLTVGVGTDEYRRLALDVDRRLGATIGGRLNLMLHENGVPGRDVERFERWGIAPSIAFGLGTPTRVTLSYLHQEDDNIPQYGVPYYENALYDGLLPGVDTSNYYGFSNFDTQQIGVDVATATVTHDFSDSISIRNLTRVQRTTQFTRATPPQGTWCIETTGQTPTGGSCGAVLPGNYLSSGPVGSTRDTVNELAFNQTDLSFRFDTGGIRHTLVTGLAFSFEDYEITSGNSLRNPGNQTPNPTIPQRDISDPDHVWAGPINFIPTASTESSLDSAAWYLFERAELGEHWEINGGLRIERTEGETAATTITTTYPNPPVYGVPTLTSSENDLLSYRLGLVYNPIEDASIYIAFGNSETPSQASVNGSCSNVGGANGAASCNTDPEEARNYELGAKWEVFGERLLLTAAIFRNERNKVRVNSGDVTVPDAQLNGQNRVDGIALGASGRINDRWAVFANYTYLESEVLQSISDIQLGNGVVDVQAGNPLTNTPEHSFSLWTTYELTENLQIGYGATYQGEFYLNNGAAPLFTSEAYWVHNAAVTYEITDRVGLRLNLNNLADEEYFQRIRNNGWATPGPARSAVLSLVANF